MAWTDPITFVSGNVLTAAQMNVIQANLLAGGPTYATEAARLTAIPSPFEGQHAYITGSTETTAVGNVTAIPTGIRTIYNGSGWVTVTPVGSYSNTSSTLTSTAYTSAFATGDTAANSVTLRTGTSALVMLYANSQHNTAGGVGQVTVAVSGASAVAAADANSCIASAGGVSYWFTNQRTFAMVTGLVAGINTFTLNHKTLGGTLTTANRAIVVQGIA